MLTRRTRPTASAAPLPPGPRALLYNEIIPETLPAHVAHWLHVDLPQRLAHLGYPLTTVTAAA